MSKKKVLSVLVCVSILLGLLTITSFGSTATHYTPAGAAAGSGVSKLSVEKATPDPARKLSVGLSTASDSYISGALTSAQIAEIGNIDLGFSIIGLKGLGGVPCSAAVDNTWTTGTLFRANADGNYYNVAGEKGKADSIYRMLFTMNFGYVCQLDSIAFAHSFGSYVGFPSAADVYVSDDGVNWTLIGYWDRAANRMNGGGDLCQGENLKSNLFGKDATGNTLDGKAAFHFAFPENTTGKYLRLAVTGLQGIAVNSVTDKTSYSAWFEDFVTFREMFVYGEAADVNYVGSQERTYTESETSKYDVRFLASMDDYNLYSEAGFKISADFENGIYAETGKTYTDACDYVYTALTAADGESGNIKTVSASEYHAGQMMALTIKGIPTNTGTVTFTVTPYYVLRADGTTVDAQSYTVVYNAGAFVSCTPVA